ncbi:MULTISPECIES: dual OB domain-containing protein [Calothrix]|uniref:Dual OB-containing domain-containing protein n=2 Tax=Calothrix TaxID=1186 RepID=A0ABR8AJ31_9CYAN|nr:MULTISPECIES: hypothetical protein [Calothrix]MBD2199904.1 hypothetical protein [Calothrix parietina FACHB-288]MBD2228749.1 hypothetical protein [Calothrix anomala FACHB-343]
MAQIICLANSWKLGERCIAGINLATGQWVRPVSSLYPEDGRVPRNMRIIQGKEPALLDILEIPLENNGPDFGFESENLTIATGTWKRVGQAQCKDILQYCGKYPYVLHNSNKYVTVTYLQSLPFYQRRTLQLVYAQELVVSNAQGSQKWQATLLTNKGQPLTNARITDPIFVKRLESGYLPKNPCMVTVSLSLPYLPSNNWEGDPPCWKLIAGIIELSDYDLIFV